MCYNQKRPDNTIIVVYRYWGARAPRIEQRDTKRNRSPNIYVEREVFIVVPVLAPGSSSTSLEDELYGIDKTSEEFCDEGRPPQSSWAAIGTVPSRAIT